MSMTKKILLALLAGSVIITVIINVYGIDVYGQIWHTDGLTDVGTLVDCLNWAEHMHEVRSYGIDVYANGTDDYILPLRVNVIEDQIVSESIKQCLVSYTELVG